MRSMRHQINDTKHPNSSTGVLSKHYFKYFFGGKGKLYQSSQSVNFHYKMHLEITKTQETFDFIAIFILSVYGKY